MEILFSLAGLRSVGQRGGKCLLSFLTDGSFNVTAERSPAVSAVARDTIKHLQAEDHFCAPPPSSFSLFHFFFSHLLPLSSPSACCLAEK